MKRTILLAAIIAANAAVADVSESGMFFDISGGKVSSDMSVDDTQFIREVEAAIGPVTESGYESDTSSSDGLNLSLSIGHSWKMDSGLRHGLAGKYNRVTGMNFGAEGYAIQDTYTQTYYYSRAAGGESDVDATAHLFTIMYVGSLPFGSGFSLEYGIGPSVLQAKMDSDYEGVAGDYYEDISGYTAGGTLHPVSDSSSENVNGYGLLGNIGVSWEFVEDNAVFINYEASSYKLDNDYMEGITNQSVNVGFKHYF